MREIQAAQITEVVAKLCVETNEHLVEDVNMQLKITEPARIGNCKRGSDKII